MARTVRNFFSDVISLPLSVIYLIFLLLFIYLNVNLHVTGCNQVEIDWSGGCRKHSRPAGVGIIS